VNNLLNFIIKSLDKKDFLQPLHKRKSMINNIKNIFYRSDLSEQEIRILLGIFASLSDLNNKS
jgi:tRNA C32,U32 (ribose-2'-O)-methylase TrmJ